MKFVFFPNQDATFGNCLVTYLLKRVRACAYSEERDGITMTIDLFPNQDVNEQIRFALEEIRQVVQTMKI